MAPFESLMLQEQGLPSRGAPLPWSTWAIIRISQAGGLNQRELISSQFWRLKSKIKVLAGGFCEASPPGWQAATSLLCPPEARPEEASVSPPLTRTHSYRI